jgi:hypothetical protein
MYADRKSQLNDWISHKHQGQRVKGTAESYFDHLLAVAGMAAPYATFGYEVGLSHDLLEKTDVIPALFYRALIKFGYEPDEADRILSQVIELTDVFTKAAYPDLNKSERKEREEKRLSTISAEAQTVKYADLIYNIAWIRTYDKKKAAGYLARKKALLLAMDKGDPALRQKALAKCEL